MWKHNIRWYIAVCLFPSSMQYLLIKVQHRGVQRDSIHCGALVRARTGAVEFLWNWLCLSNTGEHNKLVYTFSCFLPYQGILSDIHLAYLLLQEPIKVIHFSSSNPVCHFFDPDAKDGQDLIIGLSSGDGTLFLHPFTPILIGVLHLLGRPSSFHFFVHGPSCCYSLEQGWSLRCCFIFSLVDGLVDRVSQTLHGCCFCLPPRFKEVNGALKPGVHVWAGQCTQQVYDNSCRIQGKSWWAPCTTTKMDLFLAGATSSYTPLFDDSMSSLACLLTWCGCKALVLIL